MERDRHHLLRRQAARLLRDEPRTPALEQFLDAVDNAYHQADDDRRLLERSLELTSEELLEQNTALQRALVAEKARHTRIVQLHDALAALATVLAQGLDLVSCMNQICREVVEVLDVERASVWRFDEIASTMTCLAMHSRSNKMQGPTDVAIDRHPMYVSALSATRVLAIDDLGAHSELRELASALGSVDVTAGLAAPCRIAGHVVGVVNIAFTQGRREWTADEKLFASSVADCVSLALESERRHREEERRIALEADLRQRQRMDSIGMLAGGIAHDFNNLLVPIVGNTDLLLETLDLANPDRELVDEIHQAGQSARELVAQLLAFSRKQVLQLRTVDVADEARKVARLLLRALPEHIVLELDLENGLEVSADPGQLQQVILNLVVNAKDAMSAGGKIRVVGRRDAAQVVLAIEDTGVGMDEDTLAKVFEPFFTTKELGRGTGLGLSTAYGIVEQHGGTLTVTSQLGRGSRFEITLPHVAGAAVRSRRARPTATRRREAVLLVEDEPMVLGVCKRLLASAGYHVIAAGGPVEALAHAATHPEIELVITDVMMPVMNGAMMFEEMAELLPNAGVLYMSGYDNEVLAPQGVLADDVALLRKPFSGSDLTAAVKHALERLQFARRATSR